MLVLALALASCSFDPHLSRSRSSSSSDDHIDAETGENGLIAGVYHIYDRKGLKEWADDYSDLSAELHACIDWDGSPWTPVGTDSTDPYNAIFEGGGHTVSGLVVSVSGGSTDYAGFFGYLRGKVQNLGLENASVAISGTSASYAGAIAGYSYYGAIADCWFTGDVEATEASSTGYNRAGGIVGAATSTTIDGCWSTGDIAATGSSGNGNHAGGIAGTASNTTITGCYSTGNITATGVNSSYAGGIAGYALANSMTTACYYSTGKVKSRYAGGIIGRIYNSTATACYSTGDVDGIVNAGGIAGQDASGSTITACYYSNAALGVGSAAADTSGETDIVDGSSITWKTAREKMNEALAGTSTSWRYGTTSASNPPTLVQD